MPEHCDKSFPKIHNCLISQAASASWYSLVGRATVDSTKEWIFLVLFTFISFEEYLRVYPCVELHEQETEKRLGKFLPYLKKKKKGKKKVV